VIAARSFYSTDAYAEHYLGIRWPSRVWLAVIAQAVKDILDGPAAFELRGLSAEDAAALREDIIAAAEHWVADEANEPRRFVWVCEQLGLEVAAVRRVIARRRAA